MFKLILKDCYSSLLFALFCSLTATVIVSLISLITWFILPFNLIVVYIAGAIIAFIASFFIKRLFLGHERYFLSEEIASPVKNNFWIERIHNKNFVTKKAAVCSFIPVLILGLAFVIITVFLYPTLSSNIESMLACFWHAAVGSLIGAMFSSLIMYAVLSIMSLKICAKCGSVNSFVYDGETDIAASSAVTGPSYNYGQTRGGISYWGGGYNAKKFESFGNHVSCHCACCGEKADIVELPEDSKILK